jgi:2-polyprenyl-3-methyl-5-hydroxy-6-metoxy-1,4-benzoquinol methylase
VRGLIYDAAILRLTSRWYQQVLARVPEGAHILDVGIGTGGALAHNADLVRAKHLRVTGIDIDPDYIDRSQRRLSGVGLRDHVDVKLESVYDHGGGPYDAVYFSASFMLLPQPAEALHHVTGLLSDAGRVFFTQTFQDRRSRLMERAKPLLKKVTTIDFGRVTYEEDFREICTQGGLELVELTTMDTSGPRSYRLAVGVPRADLGG